MPLIDPKTIKNLALATINSDADITTLATKINKPEDIINPNIVKIALANPQIKTFSDQQIEIARALYFSRSPIPYFVNNQDTIFYHHIGIYGYKPQILAKFINLSPSKLEKSESLEQLRALENNMSIAVGIVEEAPISVDVKEDLLKVCLLSQNHNI